MTNKQIQKALLKYSELNHLLLKYTSDFFDSAQYDIEGFYNSIYYFDNWESLQWSDLIDTEALQNQIKAMQHIINGYKLFNPTYA